MKRSTKSMLLAWLFCFVGAGFGFLGIQEGAYVFCVFSAIKLFHTIADWRDEAKVKT